MIIFLNGTSSSGKSVIAREIMRQSERPFLYYSVDHIVNYWIDEKFVALEDEPKAWFFHQHVQSEPGRTAPHRVEGPDTHQLHWDMIESLMVFVKKGYDLIIDEVLWNREIFQRYTPLLCYANSVFLFKIICNLIECERREKQRVDRFVGLARALYEQVYISPPDYDFEVDTTYKTIKQSATDILQFVQQNRPHAFLDYVRAEVSLHPLTEEHFGLLTQWMNTAHVASWWGENKSWTLKDVQEKYTSYVKGYKLNANQKKPISAFLIYCAEQPIGYIQFYNAHDFPREGYTLSGSIPSLAALDLYIGEPAYLGKGIGVAAIKKLLKEFIWPRFEACLVDPDLSNMQAIRAYEAAGFKTIKQLSSSPVVLMLQKRNNK